MELKKLIKTNFPDLSDPLLLDEISKHSSIKEIKKGEVLINIGEYSRFIPLVIKGGIKILREDDKGHELLMYYLLPGQTCAVSFQCCIDKKPSEIQAIAEKDTSFISIPVEYMEKWMGDYSNWRSFVMNIYSMRFSKMVHSIDEIAFNKLDDRLEHYLNKKAEILSSNEIITTHQDIAFDLNTSREVISRLLKKMEKAGQIKSGRNKITLIENKNNFNKTND